MGELYGGGSLFTFLLITLAMGGSAAYLSGRAIAQTWRPFWHLPLYMLLLAAAVRFCHYALFQEPLLGAVSYGVDFVVAMAAAALGYRPGPVCARWRRNTAGNTASAGPSPGPGGSLITRNGVTPTQLSLNHLPGRHAALRNMRIDPSSKRRGLDEEAILARAGAGCGHAGHGGSALAQIKMGVAGPMTGGSAAFGAQLKNGAEQAVEDINAAGGILGQKIQLSVVDDRAEPKDGVSTANKLVGDGVKFVIGHFNSGRHHPRLQRLRGERHAGDHAGGDQPHRDRARLVERVSHLRPRRPAGCHRRRHHRAEVCRQARRRRARQDHLRPGPRRRDAQGLQRQGPQGSLLRGRQQGRQGLHRAGLQAQAGQPRPRLLGRPARHRRLDRAPDARPGPEGPADGRRRHHRRRVRGHRRAQARKAR